MSEISDIAALAAAFGVGSIGTAVVSRARELRGARARVLVTLGDVETSRWIPPDGPSFDPAIRDFVSAAMIARVPRARVEEYAALARVAYWTAMARVEESEPDGPSIPNELAVAVDTAARSVVDAVWHPVLARCTGRVAARRVEQVVKKLDSTELTRLGHARRRA